MIRTGLPAELRRWPLRVPRGLRQSSSSYPNSLDIPIDIPSDLLAVPNPRRMPKGFNKSRAPQVVSLPSQPVASTSTRTTRPPRQQLTLFPKLSNLIGQIGKLEHSFEAVIETFMAHIDEVVASRPLVVKSGKTEHQHFGSVAEIRSRQHVQAERSTGDLPGPSLLSLAIRGRRALINKEASRIDFCLQAVLRHPHGLPAGKTILDRLLQEGIVPSQETLTMVLKGTIRRLRDNSEGLSARDLSAAQKLCRTLLERVPYADAQLFNLIATLQIVSGTPSIDMVKLVGDYMALEGKTSTTMWMPQAYDLIMRAYRRDEDIKGVMRWYALYLQSRDHQKRQEEQQQVAAGSNKADLQARIWPYITMLHANADARSTRRAKGKTTYIPSSDHPASIIRQIVQDDLEIPSELYGYLIGRAIAGRDIPLAQRLSSTARDRARKTGTALSPLVWTSCFSVLARSKADPDDVQAHVAQMEQQSHADRSSREPSAEDRRKLYTSIAQAALAGGRGDFALALWAMEEYQRTGLTLDNRTIDAVSRSVLTFSLDHTRNKAWIEAVLGKDAVDQLCSTRRSMLSRDRTPFLVRQRGIKLLHWNVNSWRLYRLSLELSKSQASTPMDRMIYLPLGRPLARLQETPNPIDMRRASSIRAQLYDYRWWREATGAEGIRSNSLALGTALQELLRRGVSAQGLIAGREEREIANADEAVENVKRSIAQANEN